MIFEDQKTKSDP